MRFSVFIKSTIFIIVVFLLLNLNSSCTHDPFYTAPDTTGVVGENAPCSDEIIYFSKDVLPLMLSSCAYVGCHDAQTAEDGVILDNYANVIRTGGVEAGNPQNSEFYTVLNEGGGDVMPPPSENNPWSESQKKIIETWILQGAEDLTCNFCDTTVFTYTGAVLTMMNNYCLTCHDDASSTNIGGGISLQGYTKLKTAVDNGSFWGSLTAWTSSTGFSKMPQGASIPDCELTQVRKWIADGAQDN